LVLSYSSILHLAELPSLAEQHAEGVSFAEQNAGGVSLAQQNAEDVSPNKTPKAFPNFSPRLFQPWELS